MKAEQENKRETGKGSKIRLSLVYKLNTRLILRLLLLFLVLDLFLCSAIAVGTVIRSERTIELAILSFEEQGLPLGSGTAWTEAAGYRILRTSEEREGIGLPYALQEFLPQYAEDGRRSLAIPKEEGLIYRYDFLFEGRRYSVQILLGDAWEFVAKIGKILGIGQLVILVLGFISVGRTIRGTLRPIADLAETARSLNREGLSFSLDKMETLADRLDAINAARLDTRIPLDETQDELRSLAEAINGMLDRINESYRSQARFVSDASHELRTPISVIQGYASLLDRWGKNDETTLQESIDAIMEETANMKSLIEQLLFLARGDNDSMPLQMEPFQLSDLAMEVYREAKMIDPGHEYEATFAPVSVNADKGLIKQALRILTDNAMKYSNPGGTIYLTVTEKEDTANVTVQDEGIGIPAEAVPLIFERFYRTDESRARATGGAGLGLSIAKWIAERHGGHMEVLSRQDFGTRVTIALPKASSKN